MNLEIFLGCNSVETSLQSAMESSFVLGEQSGDHHGGRE